MRNWKFKINIKQFIDGDETLERSKMGIVNYLKEDKIALKAIPKKFVVKFSKVKSVKAFDRVLSELYDYGDANGIWLGL